MLLFTLLFGTRGQLTRMQISPGFRQKNARESHSNLKLPNAKQKIQDVWEQKGASSVFTRMQISPGFRQKNARESHSNLKLPNAKQKIQDVWEQKGASSVQPRKSKILFFLSAADFVTLSSCNKEVFI